MLVALPFIAVLAAFYATVGLEATLTVGVILLVFYILGVALLNGAVGSFLTTYWTLSFRRLDLDPLPYAPFQPPAQAGSFALSGRARRAGRIGPR